MVTKHICMSAKSTLHTLQLPGNVTVVKMPYQSVTHLSDFNWLQIVELSDVLLDFNHRWCLL